MIKPIKQKHSSVVAKIHKEALAGDFLPSLGFNFLNTFYDGVIGKPGVYGFVSEEKGEVNGFVLGTIDSSRFFYQGLKSRFFQLSFYLALQLIRQPYLIKNVLETFHYPNKDIGPKAELVVIAVSPKWRGKGIGKKLVRGLEKTFLSHGVKEYKLTVHADKKAVGFYEHLGYHRLSSFRLYGKMWYLFKRVLKLKSNAKKVNRASKNRKS